MTRILAPTPTRTGAPSHSPPDTRYVPGYKITRGLGWFSVGLGLTELLLPGAIEKLTCVPRRGLLQSHGLREIVCGIGILRSPRPAGWLWARVAGDAIDLATLAEPLKNGRECRGRALRAAAAVGGVTALDLLCSVMQTAVAKLEP